MLEYSGRCIVSNRASSRQTQGVPGTHQNRSRRRRPWLGVGACRYTDSPYVFGKAIEIETPLLYTYKNYQQYEFNMHGPAAKSHFYLNGGYSSRPEDKFFGLGNDTPLSNESFYKTVQREAEVGYSALINDKLRAAIGVGFEKIGVTKPEYGESAQQVFTEDQVPGLFTGATMRNATLAIDHNTQDELHNATRGGREIVAVGLHESVGASDFAFWKYRLELQRYFSLSPDRRKSSRSGPWPKPIRKRAAARCRFSICRTWAPGEHCADLKTIGIAIRARWLLDSNTGIAFGRRSTGDSSSTRGRSPRNWATFRGAASIQATEHV